jgi:hypothetical protein
MKKLFLLVLNIFVFQSLMAQDFGIGPKLGISQGTIIVAGEGFESGESSIGYHLGAFVRMGGGFVFVQPEFLYTNTGGSILQKMDNGMDIKLDASFDRLDIPLIAGIKLAKFFRIQAGPVATVLLNYELSEALQAAGDTDYSGASFGYQAGLGLDVGNFILDFKYENSISKIATSIAGFNADQRQAMLIFSAGFRIF